MAKGRDRQKNPSGFSEVAPTPTPWNLPMSFLTLNLTIVGISNGGGGLVAKLYLTLATPWTVACQAPLSTEF